MLTAGTASAHTNLIGGEPEPGGLTPNAPRALVLRLDEPVDARRADVRVVGPRGRRVDRGLVAPARNGLRVPLREELANGGYSVAYRLTSPEDGHTVSGGYSFSIGARVAPPPVALEGLVGSVRPARAVTPN